MIQMVDVRCSVREFSLHSVNFDGLVSHLVLHSLFEQCRIVLVGDPHEMSNILSFHIHYLKQRIVLTCAR